MAADPVSKPFQLQMRDIAFAAQIPHVEHLKQNDSLFNRTAVIINMENLDKYISSYNAGFEYTFDNTIILNWYPRRILEKSPKSAKVLELGIGHGYSFKWFSENFESYTVIDGSPAVIQKLLKEFPETKAQIVESYFEEFQTDEKFDVIIMGFVLEHVENPASILVKYKSFLKPNGRCFVAVPNAECLHRRIGNAAGYLDNMFTLSEADLSFGHRRLYSVETLTQEIENCGYKITNKEGIFLKPLTTSQLKELKLSENIIQGMCHLGVKYPELSAALLFELTPSKIN
jgi:2-polyprenyl-3-methyl-5-hydroxy-6-metoxy-1,4-benzoquinol methylase